MQNETPSTETKHVQSYMEFVIEFITDKHFQILEEETKKEFYSRFTKNFETHLQNEYRKGFFEGKIEGMNAMAEALNNSRK
jgi:hypothetical protein